MREERKLNKAIKRDGVDTQSDILDELKRRYPQYVERSENKKVPANKRRTTFIFALAAVAVCAAIIVPCAILLPNRGNNGPGGGENFRYCTQSDYTMSEVEYSIGEYRANNNKIFLYFDWYESGEDRNTVCYTSNSDNEVLCLQEYIYLTQTDEFVQFTITKSNVFLSAFDQTIEHCNKEQNVSNHKVKWAIQDDNAYCIFEDGGYRYFIQIEQGQDENRLFELVSELLGNN